MTPRDRIRTPPPIMAADRLSSKTIQPITLAHSTQLRLIAYIDAALA